jgi:hypothetical protein
VVLRLGSSIDWVHAESYILTVPVRGITPK